ncbi:YebC/PmpR family DNA-binding transcriptional regulator, partial [candidate division WOR-3 bacterium]|nr:YebC/PmpR family DNA-binding transcriptional regulator [candidate division WOR-3 bacterium]
AWQFQAQGIITVGAKKYDEDTIIAYALEGGATDVKTEEDTYQIISSPENYSKVKDILQNNKIEIISSELTRIPQNTIPLGGKEAEKVLKLYEALDAVDDVQHVYANFDISEEVMEKISSEAG